MHSHILRHGAAVVAAGVAGTLANAVAAALIVDGALIRFTLVPGRYAVAILVAAALPIVFRRFDRQFATAIGLVLLTVAPSLLAKLAFGAGAPWPTVLGLNAVYALAAVAVFLIAERILPSGSPAVS